MLVSFDIFLFYVYVVGILLEARVIKLAVCVFSHKSPSLKRMCEAYMC